MQVFASRLSLLFLMLSFAVSAEETALSETEKALSEKKETAFVDEKTISWKGNEYNVSRFKTLVGGNEGEDKKS